jgi:hypothetical protein
MTEDQLMDQKTVANNIELVKNIILGIDTISMLLYEMKAATPLGKTLKVLFNLFNKEGKSSSGKTINLTGVSFRHMAGMAGISEKELQEALDCLQRQGVIFYRRSP